MSRRGFGDLIAQRRESAGITPEEMAKKLGYKSKSVIYRLEGGEQEPSVEVINRLIALLPLSAEELLQALGVHLIPPQAAKLPTDLIEGLLSLGPQQLATVHELVRFLNTASGQDGASARLRTGQPGGR